jgi:outer membrane protein
MKFLLLIVFNFFHAAIFCQQVYSLADCFLLAKQNNVSFKKNRNDIQSNYIDKKAATFNLLPAVYASAEHIYSSGKNIDPVTNNFVREDFSGGDFDVTMQLNIFSGFNNLNAIKNSLYKIKASEYAYRENELKIFSAITVAYAEVMFNKEQVATIRNNTLHTQNALVVVQEKIDAGRLSKTDYYTINTRNKSEQADIAEAQNDSVTAMNELKYLTGLNYNTPFSIKDIDSGEIRNITLKEFNLSEVLERVLKDHPALLQTMFSEKSAEMNLKTARGDLYPNLSITGNIFSNYNLNYRNLGNSHVSVGEQINNNFGKTAGILLEIPLFNKYQNRFAIEREKINFANAKLATTEIENDILKNTQQMLNDFITAKQKYLLQQEALQQAILSFNAFEERHKLGYISSLELMLAKDQLYTQQVKTTQAKYDLYFKYMLIRLLLETADN